MDNLHIVNDFFQTQATEVTWDNVMLWFEAINKWDHGAYRFVIFHRLGYITSNTIGFSIGHVRRYNIQASAPETLEAVFLTVVEFVKWRKLK